MTLKMIDVDEKLWMEYKKKCFNDGKTMKGTMNELLKEYIYGG